MNYRQLATFKLGSVQVLMRTAVQLCEKSDFEEDPRRKSFARTKRAVDELERYLAECRLEQGDSLSREERPLQLPDSNVLLHGSIKFVFKGRREKS